MNLHNFYEARVAPSGLFPLLGWYTFELPKLVHFSIAINSTTMPLPQNSDLVLRAIRVAEKAHRTRAQGPHLRKAPAEEDRPYYMVHLAEVSWMLTHAGASDELIAAGWLHDVLEDCGYTALQLEQEIGNKWVTTLVEWVSEPGNAPSPEGKKEPWESRNRKYLERMREAPREALDLSCADKTANITEMCTWLDKGYLAEEFTSRDHLTQLAKFEDLDHIYRGRVDERIYIRFTEWLATFRMLAPGSRAEEREHLLGSSALQVKTK